MYVHCMKELYVRMQLTRESIHLLPYVVKSLLPACKSDRNPIYIYYSKIIFTTIYHQVQLWYVRSLAHTHTHTHTHTLYLASYLELLTAKKQSLLEHTSTLLQKGNFLCFIVISHYLLFAYCCKQLMFSVVDYGQELVVELQDWNLKLKSQQRF